MRLLLANPNTSPTITERLARAARAHASAGTTVIEATARTGVPYISSRAEAAIAAPALLETIAAHRPEIDGAIVAAFGDPGLEAAREIFDIPVIGLAEAGMITACLAGRRFSIVTFTPAMGPWYQECVDRHAMTARCASIRCLDAELAAIDRVAEDNAALLARMANAAAREDGADVVVLGGAPLSGLAPLIADEVLVPLIDCAAAAVRQLETLVALRLRKARSGAFRRPGPKAATGVAPALADWLAHR